MHVAKNIEFEASPRSSAWLKPRQLERLEARLALTENVQKQAYALRHDGYVAVGYMKPAETGHLEDEYDRLESSKTIVLYKNGRAAASARVCLLDPTSNVPGAAAVPACAMFGDEITALLDGLGGSGRAARAAEITKLARHPEFLKDNDLVYAIFRMVGYLILHINADVVLSSVRASHVHFYKRLGFQSVVVPRPHPKFDVATGLMACFQASYEGVRHNVPVMKHISQNDATYSRFIAGELVPVFPQVRVPSLTDTGNRFHYPVDQNSMLAENVS